MILRNPGSRVRAAAREAGATPRVTIGMPAYNSRDTIVDAIRSLLDQTWRDFELIVSDNASTDGTPEVVARLAAEDDRIRLVRRTENVGANANYSSLVALARGEFFKWASSNDWCAPTFVERCVDRLDSAADVVLVCPSTATFEDDPAVGELYCHDLEAMADDPVERLLHVLSNIRLNNAMNGVFRLDVLGRTRLIDHFPGSDTVLVGNVALYGKIARLPERLYFRRMSARASTSLMDADRLRRHHYPERTVRELFPLWRRHWAVIRAVRTSPLTQSQRLRALRAVVRMAGWDRAGLLRDVASALRYPFAQSP